MLIIPRNRKLTVNQCGRRFVVTAVADNERDANRHMMEVSTDAVLLVVGNLIVMADVRDRGEPVPNREGEGGS